jgi:hypothetical protein
MSSSSFEVIFLTAAEVPKTTNVGTSQILEVASALKEQGVAPLWLSVLPWQALVGSARREKAVEQVAAKCREAGLVWEKIYFGSQLFDARMLPFRKVYARLCARWLLPKIRARRLQTNVVINARSYYATDIALELKKLLTAQGHQVAVCFDMRGLLSLSYPASASGDKFKAFGRMKAWEAELASQVQVIFNNRRPAIELFRREYGLEITCLPVAGFARSRLRRVSFEERWRHKRVAFVGTLSDKFNRLDVLHRQLRTLRSLGFDPVIVSDSANASSTEFPVTRIDYANMPDFYAGCLAIVLPGRDEPETFFERLALRIYTAPTKISESLSAGVPVIVGSCFEDICAHVREHDCGVVYDLQTNQFQVPDGFRMEDRSLWEQLSAGAERVGPEFSRERVLEIYLSAWQKLFSSRAAGGPAGPDMRNPKIHADAA